MVPIKQVNRRRPLVNSQFSDSLPQLYDYNSVVQLRTFGRPVIPPLPQAPSLTNPYLTQNSLLVNNNNNTIEARRSPYYYNDLATLRMGDKPTTPVDPNKNLKYFPTNRYEPRIDINEFDFENNNARNEPQY